jgi:hypothetical protein
MTRNLEKITREEFEQYVCDTFQLNEYSERLANEINDVLSSLVMKKRNCVNKLLAFVERYKDRLGTEDIQEIIDIIKHVGSRIVADERIKEVERQKKDHKLQSVLNELDKALSKASILDLLSSDTIHDHIRLTGEYPTKENILKLFSFHAYCEPPDYLSTHMKRTRYRSPVNYAKALFGHLSAIMHQVMYD